MPANARPQTSKQAKAAFKARGRPTLSETQQHQLERAVELEARAERARDKELRRIEAVKKRAEKKQKEEKKWASAILFGTQRRCDRFGFKASQFHLGAFYEKRGQSEEAVRKNEMKKNKEEVKQVVEEDIFEDKDLDDDLLLEALDGPFVHERCQGQEKEFSRSDATQPDSLCLLSPTLPSSGNHASLPHAATAFPPMNQDDLSSFWEELGTGTQIARELNGNEVSVNISFNSGDFDLTAEDLDELNPPQQWTENLTRPIRSIVPTPTDLQKTHSADLGQLSSTRHPEPECFEGYVKTQGGTAKSFEQTPSQSMPPPPPTLKHNTNHGASGIPRCQARKLPEPFLVNQATMDLTHSATKDTHQNQSLSQAVEHAGSPKPKNPSARPTQSKPQRAITDPFLPASSLYCSPNLGFTSSQLESFIDEDIQLTQAVPG